MNKYKVGQIVRDNRFEINHDYEIIEVFSRCVIIKNAANFATIEMIDTLDEYYTIIKDIAWKPEGDGVYWYITDNGYIDDWIIWKNNRYDKFRLATKNVFRTKEEAEARLSEIKKQYGIK